MSTKTTTPALRGELVSARHAWLALIVFTILDIATTVVALLSAEYGHIDQHLVESNTVVAWIMTRAHYHACMEAVSCASTGGEYVGTVWFGIHASDILAALALVPLAVVSLAALWVVTRIEPRYAALPISVFVLARILAVINNTALLGSALL